MKIRHLTLGLSVAASALFASASVASADDYCREYTSKIRVGGAPRSGYGTACMEQDGSWRIVSESYGGGGVSDDLIEAEPAYYIDNRPILVREVYWRGHPHRHGHGHGHGGHGRGHEWRHDRGRRGWEDGRNYRPGRDYYVEERRYYGRGDDYRYRNGSSGRVDLSVAF
ncbi:MAG: hypothetical protein ABW189_08125 [Rickettsiales bacterium]